MEGLTAILHETDIDIRCASEYILNTVKDMIEDTETAYESVTYDYDNQKILVKGDYWDLYNVLYALSCEFVLIVR